MISRKDATAKNAKEMLSQKKLAAYHGTEKPSTGVSLAAAFAIMRARFKYLCFTNIQLAAVAQMARR